MRLLIDTQVVVWSALADQRIPERVKAAILSADNSLFVSAVTAFEFTDLRVRGRYPVNEPLDVLADAIGFEVIDLPAEAWRIAEALPDIHRDPVDRMIVAHAIIGGFTLITSDAAARTYPVSFLW